METTKCNNKNEQIIKNNPHCDTLFLDKTNEEFPVTKSKFKDNIPFKKIYIHDDTQYIFFQKITDEYIGIYLPISKLDNM